jgi:hypothetical protein
LAKVFGGAGVKDYRVPKNHPSSALFNYDELDLRSIRIVNRLIHHLGTEQLSFSDFMKDLVTEQTVKTKQGNTKVEIFMANKFFEKLKNLKVKKSVDVH